MMKKGAPYSGARRKQNQQVADGGSLLGAAARALRTIVPGGETMVDNVGKSKPGNKESGGYTSQGRSTRASPKQQEDYTSTPADEKRMMDAAKNRSRARGGQ